MKNYRQDPPFCVKVEFSEGCNLYCDFCGLQSIRDIKVKNFKFMTLDTARRIAESVKEAGWHSRIEFTMHGEPTMNPNMVQLVKLFREWLPNNSLMMTSNGGGLLRPPGILANLNALFDAGLNIYAFDAYESVKIKDKVMPEVKMRKGRTFDVMYYPDDKEASPYQRRGSDARVFIRLADISVVKGGNRSKIHNSGGTAGPPTEEMSESRCARPFRELAFRWDGSVAICCDDWRGAYKCGNIHKQTLDQIWQGEAFMAARRSLYRGRRTDIEVCSGCSDRSFRVGLLPDQRGKKTLPKPDAKSFKQIAKAEGGKPYTPPVLRAWEKGYKPVKLKDLPPATPKEEPKP